MRLLRLYVVILFVFSAISFSLNGQNFSFNCNRDTALVSCTSAGCITLQAIIPDLHKLTTGYSVNSLSDYGVQSCSPTYVDPNDPNGRPTNLVNDDTYTGVINIGFPFQFYGAVYNSLIASTNGVVSFDISKAGLLAHWSILNGTIPLDLPSSLYDKALIMGPYHDLDPSVSTSPLKRIQYQVLGNAPMRKWILSFYKVPLFTNAGGGCNFLTENTHQIILYESTGIIEVKIFDKQICRGWNQGRAMVGIQDFNRTKATMAPGRAASDPPWGSIGMNESWRFIPNAGPSSFKRVELYDLAGTLVATGAVSPGGPGALIASFGNICTAPSSTTAFVVKSVYEKIDDPAVEIFGIDTVRVIRTPSTVSANAAWTDATCNGSPTGAITVNTPAPGNPPFQYSLDGVNWQTSNVFSGLTAGTYTVYFQESGGCSNSTQVTIGQPSVLASSFTAAPVVCNGQNNGIINVTASGGVAPYEFSLDGGTYQNNGLFNTVGAGNHVVTIRDANGCSKTQNITVTQPNILSLNGNTNEASCDGGNDGLIILNTAGGNSSYQYSLDGINFQPSDTFHVVPGNYIITVKDNLNCIDTQSFIVGLTSNLTHTALTDPVICEGSSTQVNFVSNATNYSWSPAIGLSNTNSANTVASPTATQQYIVSYTLGRCTEEDTMIINVNAAPIPGAGADGFICYGQSYQLRATGGVVYSWSPSTFLDNPDSSNPIVKPDHTTTYTLRIVADMNNCPSLVTDQVTIDVTPPIKVKTYPQDTIVYAGDRFQLLALSIAPNYSWSPAYDLDNARVNNPTITVDKDVVLVVTASSQAGCVGEASVRIQVYKGPDIYCPTGFTPNGDGLNDKFIPFPVGIQELKYFKVFNRWGQLIFSTTKLNDGWDGTLAGRPEPSANYVWMAQGITRDGRVITKKGSIILIR
jgi:gliding motility-associated-like protein